MLTYSDLEHALKYVPLEKLPEVYKFILAHTQWPFDASPAEMEADDRTWDEQFSSEASERLFRRMAAETRAEYSKGSAKPLEELLDEDMADDQVEDDASL
jgi:hypothetical protein